MSQGRRSAALIALVVLAALAVADGLYLTQIHIALQVDPASGGSSACNAMSETGCAVTGGRFGSIGGLPVAVVGAAGALATALLALFAFVRRHFDDDPLRPLLFALTGFSVAVSVLMGILSAVEGKFCPFCVIWYALNGLQFAAAWMALDRPASRALPAAIASMIKPAGLSAVVVFGVSLGLFAWLYSAQHAAALHAAGAKRAFVPDAPTVRISLPEDAPVKRSKKWLAAGGQGEPEAMLVEFSDFECPFCKGLWDDMGTFLQETDRRVEVYHFHFPLDSACNPLLKRPMHPTACAAARAAECARMQGRFWEMGTAMFGNQANLTAEKLVELAAEVGIDANTFAGCLDSDEAHAAVNRDVTEGMRLDIQATPTLFINGRIVRGAPTIQQIRNAVEEVISGAADAKSGADTASEPGPADNSGPPPN